MIHEAERRYTAAGGDFHSQVGWHLVHGVVMVLPDSFCLGYWCKHGNELQSVEFEDADCFCATFVCGDMEPISRVLHDLVPYIAFQRELRGDSRMRSYKFQNFHRKL